MPVEIRELQINVTVNQPAAQTAQPAPAAGSGGQGDAERKALVNQCIEQVLDIMNNKKER